MKCCQLCKQIKPLSEFGNNKTRIDGKEYQCKICANEFRKQVRKNNPEMNKRSTKKWYNNNKSKHLSHINKLIKSIPSGIYKITCLINGKSYIGQSKNPYSRKTNHFSIYTDPLTNKTNSYLQADLRIYGKDNFTFEILESCSPELLLERESYYITTLKPEYNGK